MMDATSARGSELFIGIVGATGTDLGAVCDGLALALASVGYRSEQLRLIHGLHDFPKWSGLIEPCPEDQRITRYMDAGDELRETVGDGDAVARLAISTIRQMRKKLAVDDRRPAERQAYILRSLKRTEEADTLRRVYGENFFLVGAYSPRHARVTRLSSRIASSRFSASSDTYRATAEGLVHRDLEDQSKPLGQRVADTFALADCFVDASDPTGMRESIQRFVEIVFSIPITRRHETSKGCSSHTQHHCGQGRWPDR